MNEEGVISGPTRIAKTHAQSAFRIKIWSAPHLTGTKAPAARLGPFRSGAKSTPGCRRVRVQPPTGTDLRLRGPDIPAFRIGGLRDS